MNAWMHVAGWLLVHFVWQGIVVALVAALALHLCRRQSSSVRYAVACAALAAMLASVGATALFIEATGNSRAATTTASIGTAAGVRVDVLLPVHISDSSPSIVSSTKQRVEAALPWIVSVWLLGVTCLFARSAAGWWGVRRLHQRALSSTVSGWQTAATRIARQIGLTRVVRVVELAHVDVPLVVGCLRPIIVLPIAALGQLNTLQVEAILAHELAHVRRHDYLVNLMQTVAETLLFYHPAVWWLSARIRDEREHCCDDLAVTLYGDPVSYVAALTELEMWRTGEPALAPAATAGSLLNRTRRILGVELTNHAPRPQGQMALLLSAVLLAAATALAQTQKPAENLKFEVASVRPNQSGETGMSMMVRPGGRFVATNSPLRMLILNAYELQQSQLIGLPDWAASERFDITAKAEHEFPPTTKEKPSPSDLMLRSLLEERFKLVVRREKRELPGYALVLDREGRRFGPQLKVSEEDCRPRKAGEPPRPAPQPGQRRCGMRMSSGALLATSVSMNDLAMTISYSVQRPVVDLTNLEGGYDFDLKWTPDNAADTSAPSIFTALQEQLGLKLESRRIPMEVLIVDSVDRPTPD